jgi:branched-chain amino acid transport system permease protein
MGVDTALYKSLTFGVSAMYTGIAGALGVLLSAYVSPDSFPVFLSIKFLVGCVVGGIASISGCLRRGTFHRVHTKFRGPDIEGGARCHFSACS